MTDPSKRNPKQEFKELLTRKRLLQEVLNVADRVEQIHSGLNSALQMGKPTSQIDKEVLRYYEGMKPMQNMPVAKLKEILVQLESRMVANLQVVMGYAEKELDDASGFNFEEAALDLIDDFRRTSKTALAMRLLLSDKGQLTKPMALPVDQNKLRQKVSRMAEREKEVREKVETEISSIRDDSALLLKTPGLPESIKGMLQATVGQMDENLKHVRAGKGFDDLPHAVEILEAGDAPEIEEIPESLPLIEAEELAVEEVEATAVPEQKGGLGDHLNNWLNTPWKVGWKDAGKIDPDEEKD